jgi:hypothetical protein
MKKMKKMKMKMKRRKTNDAIYNTRFRHILCSNGMFVRSWYGFG